MATLVGRKPKDTIPELLTINNTGGIGSELKEIGDGTGKLSPLKLSSTGVAISGNLKMLTATETVVSIGATSGAVSFDLETGTYFTVTVTGAMTISFANSPQAGDAFGFVVEMKNGGKANVTWPKGVVWESATAPTLSAAATDLLVFVTRDGGATWFGSSRLGS